MPERTQYIIDTYGLPREQEVAACRAALGLVAHAADSFETDLVLAKLSEIPPDAAAAARHLSTHSRHRRNENDGYRQTGVISAHGPGDWDAFVAYAPYAFDARVWSASAELAALDDEGTGLSAHLLPHERDALADLVDDSRIFTKSEWKKVRRRISRERRRNRAPDLRG